MPDRRSPYDVSSDQERLSLEQSRDAARRLLGDSRLEVSSRQRQLLSYLLEEENAGRGDRLKGYSIATNVLGRSATFDPQSDSIVRVEIGRLRRSMELYFANFGNEFDFIISINKGSYRPQFYKSEKNIIKTNSYKKNMIHFYIIFLLLFVFSVYILINRNYIKERYLTNQFDHASFLKEDSKTRREIIVMPARVIVDGISNQIVSSLIHEKITSKVSSVITNLEITSKDRDDSNRDIDYVLRTTIIFYSKSVRVQFILIDAQFSNAPLSGAFDILTWNSASDLIGEMIASEIAMRLAIWNQNNGLSK